MHKTVRLSIALLLVLASAPFLRLGADESGAGHLLPGFVLFGAGLVLALWGRFGRW